MIRRVRGADRERVRERESSCCQCRARDGLLLPLLLCSNLSDQWIPRQQGLFTAAQMKRVTFLPLSQVTACIPLQFCIANKDFETIFASARGEQVWKLQVQRTNKAVIQFHLICGQY